MLKEQLIPTTTYKDRLFQAISHSKDMPVKEFYESLENDETLKSIYLEMFSSLSLKEIAMLCNNKLSLEQCEKVWGEVKIKESLNEGFTFIEITDLAENG